jgi:hypothetical protein
MNSAWISTSPSITDDPDDLKDDRMICPHDEIRCGSTSVGVDSIELAVRAIESSEGCEGGGPSF